MALTQQFASGEDLTAAKLNASSIPVVSSTADITTPFTGQVVLLTTGNLLWRYSGSAWVPYSGIVGSEVIRTSVVGTFTTTETTIDSITVGLVNGVTYRITWDSQFSTASSTSTTAVVERTRGRIREDTSSGTVVALRDTPLLVGGGVSFPSFLQVRFTAVSTGNKTFVATSQRQGAGGNIQSYADASSPTYFRVETL